MTTKQTIMPNDELYDGIELIPLNMDAVQQRIDYFDRKVRETINEDQFEFYKYHKAWTFWKELRDKHCIRSGDE